MSHEVSIGIKRLRSLEDAPELPESLEDLFGQGQYEPGHLGSLSRRRQPGLLPHRPAGRLEISHCASDVKASFNTYTNIYMM